MFCIRKAIRKIAFWLAGWAGVVVVERNEKENQKKIKGKTKDTAYEKTPTFSQ